MALDDVSISPQQMAATQGIAQSVAASSGDSAPAGQNTDPYMPFSSKNHPVIAGVGNVLLNALQGFAQARMGQDAVGQRLRSQYAQELQDRELKNREKLAREQAQQQFLQQGIQNQGSAFLNNPKIKKLIGIDNLPLYEQMGKAVDAQHENIQKALIAAHLPAAYANLSPQEQKIISEGIAAQNQQKLAGINQQTAQIKQQTAQQEGGIREKIAGIEAGTASTHAATAKIEEQKARDELNKKDKDAPDKSEDIANKRVARLNTTLNDYAKLHPVPKGFMGYGSGATPEYEAGAAKYAIERGIDPKSGRILKPSGSTNQPDGYYQVKDKTYLAHEGKVYELQ